MRTAAACFSVVVLALAMAACTSGTTRPSRAASGSSPSGFLQDYSLLAADPSQPGYRHYMDPSLQASGYRKFMIEAPVFALNTSGQYVALDPQQVASISAYYQSRMAAALAPHYQVVDAPGPGVATIRVAVVGMVEVPPRFKARNLVPLKALFDAGRKIAGKDPYVLRMSFEAEARDSVSGQLLGEAVDSRESTETVAGKSAPPSGQQVHGLVDYWVARFVANLDKANGFAN